MRKFSIAVLAVAAALAISPAAKADTYYSFSYSGGETATGWLTVTSAVVGSNNGFPGYNIVGGDIIIDGNILTLTPNPNPGSAFDSPSGAYQVDDVLYPAGGISNYLDINGVLYDGSGSISELNIWSYGGGSPDYLYANEGGGYQNLGDTSGVFTLGAPIVTPEPTSLLLLGTGLFGLAFFAFRKSKSTGALQAV